MRLFKGARVQIDTLQPYNGAQWFYISRVGKGYVTLHNRDGVFKIDRIKAVIV